MTPTEYLCAIKKINPLSHVVIWGSGVEMKPAWDDAHVGAKPTLAECEVVLPEVRTMLKEQAKEQKVKVLAEKLSEKAARKELKMDLTEIDAQIIALKAELVS